MKLTYLTEPERTASGEPEWKKVECVSVFFAKPGRDQEQMAAPSASTPQEGDEDAAWEETRRIGLALLCLLLVKIKLVALCLLATAFFIYVVERASHEDEERPAPVARGPAVWHQVPAAPAAARPLPPVDGAPPLK